MTHLFGPVPSRRLGLSLGLDLVPPKTCTYDCIYCEVGPTTCQTLDRRDYHTEAIIKEAAAYLQGPGLRPDFITLAGSGEPTLNLGLGRIIRELKGMTDLPVAVLTNGSLLYLPEVRAELALADVVLPSLDAAREETYKAVNRPHAALSLDQVLKGLKIFRQEYSGQIWLEVMVLKGLNDREPDLGDLKQAISQIAPDKVQLNTAVRPVVEDYALAVPEEELAQVARYLGEGVEVIASYRRPTSAPAPEAEVDLLAALARRPMTAQDLSQALGLPLTAVLKELDRLQEHGHISTGLHERRVFFRCRAGADRL